MLLQLNKEHHTEEDNSNILSRKARKFIIGLLSMCFTLIFSTLLVFSLAYFTGDPTNALLPANTPPEAVAVFRARLGFDKPMYLQYALYLQRLARGDLGESLRYRQPVNELLWQRAAASLQLFGFSLFLVFFGSLFFGIITAHYYQKARAYPHKKIYAWLDLSLRMGIFAIQAIPPFVLAQLLILIFAQFLRWLPVTAVPVETNQWYDLRAWKSLLLPAIAASMLPFATLSKLLRIQMLETLRQDYIITAKSKGISYFILLAKHALRNACLPVLGALSVEINTLLAGNAVVELVFAYPGLGRLMVEAVSVRDIPLIQGMVLFTTLFTIIINGFFQILYAYLDPRIKKLS